MSSTLATTRSPAPMAKSVSVAAGVRDTILAGLAAIRTSVPSSSVIVTGKAGAGVAAGAAVGATVGVAAGVGTGVGEEAPAQAETRTARISRRDAPRARNREFAAIKWVSDRVEGRTEPF